MCFSFNFSCQKKVFYWELQDLPGGQRQDMFDLNKKRKDTLKLLVTILLFFNETFCYGLSKDFYIEEYGASDVRVLNFEEIYSQVKLWDSGTFQDNDSLWYILTGKHLHFGNFNGLGKRPNYGPKKLTELANSTLPIINHNTYLPETSISTMAFETQCHWRSVDGLSTLGFLTADIVNIHFFKLDIIGDDALFATINKSKQPFFRFKTLAYQWLNFQSLNKCSEAISKMLLKNNKVGSDFNQELSVDNIFVHSNDSKRYEKFLLLNGKNKSNAKIYFVKTRKNCSEAYRNNCEYYEYNFPNEIFDKQLISIVRN